MTHQTEQELKPGSREAIVAGCKCPVLDNGHGSGYMGQPGIFVYSCGCPLHWPAEEEKPRQMQDQPS